MKACTYYRYGPPEVMQVEEVLTPQPRTGEVRIKVAYASLNSGDRRIRASDFPKGMKAGGRLAFGISKPRNKILCSNFSGVIDQVGDGVKDFKVGDRVCGITGLKMGACAEFVVMKASKNLVHVPESVDLQSATGVLFGGTTAYYFLKTKGKVVEGQKVLINGASGSVGTNAVQIAKFMGAKVTAVTSTKNVALMKELGADKVVDYTTHNIYEHEEKFDLIVDTVGNFDSEKIKALLTPTGNILLLVAGVKQQIKPGKQVKVGTAPGKKEHVVELLKMLEEKKLKVVVDNVFKPDEIVKAHELADSGHKIGNILIAFNP